MEKKKMTMEDFLAMISETRSTERAKARRIAPRFESRDPRLLTKQAIVDDVSAILLHAMARDLEYQKGLSQLL